MIAFASTPSHESDEIMHRDLSSALLMAGKAVVVLLCLVLALPGCSTTTPPTAEEASSSQSASLEDKTFIGRYKVLVPLSWDVSSSYIVSTQGNAGLWGTCGQCVVANTLNLVTGSVYTEADIVNYVTQRKLCDPTSGGMTIDDMLAVYDQLLPRNSMAAHVDAWDDAPTIVMMADMLDEGIMLNVSVYGEMMREGGHTGEGDITGTHWIVIYHADRAADGSVIGFWIIDSASSIDYLTAEELSNFYYGHDGTKILDPSCIEIFGWRYATLVTTRE